uniref:non-ribosomal peptide synthetase n=1 Tax=Millisia brevis TaxID=264148 RepID=UPI000A848EE0
MGSRGVDGRNSDHAVTDGSLGAPATDGGSIDPAGEIGRPFRLSPAQRGIWLAQHLNPSVPITIAQYVDVTGNVDRAVLHAAVRRGAGEIESGYVRLLEIDGEPFQVVDPTLGDDVGYVDLRDDPDPVAAAQRWMRDDYSAPVDLTADRLIRSSLLRVGEDRWFWYACVHHIVLDGFGARTFMNRVAELYTEMIGTPDPVLPTATAVDDDLRRLVDDEWAYRDTSRFAADREHWLERVADVESGISLSGETAEPGAVARVDRGEVSPEVTASMKDLIAEIGSSTAGVVIAAVAAYVSRMVDSPDVIISLPVTARVNARMRRAGGMVSNVVPMRLRVDRDTTVADLVARVGLEVVGALRHQRYRYEDIRRDVVGGTAGRSFFGPLVNVMLFHSRIHLGSDVGELNVLTTGAVEDASINLYQGVGEARSEAELLEGGTRIHLDLETNPNLYGDAVAAGHHARLMRFLAAFVAAGAGTSVHRIPILDDAELADLDRWNATTRELPNGAADDTLADHLARTAARDGSALALGFEGTTLTYAEFDRQVARLARALIDAGVGPESVVAVAIDRSNEMLVAIHAVIRAGGAYLPIDRSQPYERIRHILDTARPTLVLVAQEAHRPTDPDAANGEAVVPVVALDTLDTSGYSDGPITDADRLGTLLPDHPAYVIFTSGSTGRPKGVMVSHRAIVNRIEWMQAEYGLGPTDVVLHKTPTTFDVSVWELFWPFLVGARLEIARPDGHRDPRYLHRVIRERGVTTLHFVPSMMAVFVAESVPGSYVTEAISDAHSVRLVFASGEALPRALADRLLEQLPGAALHNLYGPTEAAVDVTYHHVQRGGGAVPIGAPVWNTTLPVLSSQLEPVPIGVPAELYIAGVQLARGYVGRPGLTAERFVAAPGGGRQYRTGDIVFHNADGELEYIGRRDFQVKLRGQRIELGEIERVLLESPGVDHAAALVVTVPTDRLIGYVVGSAVLDPEQVRRAAAEMLPDFMVPSMIVVLDEFPLGSSGKLDRKALPIPDVVSRPFRAPQTPTEISVAAVLSDVLHRDEVGLDDSFFDLGGDSLIAARLVARLAAQWQVQLGVRAIFEAPVVEDFARLIDEQIGSRRSDAPALTRAEHAGPIPLSLAQQRMWLINKFDPEAAAYNLPFVIRMRGKVAQQALARALDDVVERHETLRTIFPEGRDGIPYQLILDPSAVTLDVRVESATEQTLPALLRRFAMDGFDVSREIPFRIRVFELSPDDVAVAMVVHHISADGVSFGPLSRDLMAAYTSRADGRAPDWQPLPIRYADYSVWQREVLGSEEDPESLASEQIGYWKRRLVELPDQIDLPFDHPRPPVQSLRGGRVAFEIPSATYQGLTALARTHGTTAFMAMHAAFAVLLARLSGTSDIAVGSAVAGRGERELDDVIGMFVNTLVLRSTVEPRMSFGAVLDQVRDTDLEAFGNADVPFERLVEVLNPVRSQARQPLFQVILSYQTAGRVQIELPDLTVSADEVDIGVAKFDLQLTVTEELHDTYTGTPMTAAGVGGARAEFVYAVDLLDEATVAGFADRLLRILDAVVGDPTSPVGDIDIMDAAEHRLLNTTADPAPSPITLLGLIERAVASRPDEPAVIAGTRTLTYRQLDEASNRLARRLIRSGAGPEKVVAVAVPRSVESITAMWAVAKTGAAFVPIDPAYPANRIEHMVDNSGAIAGVTVVAARGDLPDVMDWIFLDGPSADQLLAEDPTPIGDADRLAAIEVDSPAYLIYTSGSTGLPKGVMVPHRGLATQVRAAVERLGVEPGSRVLHFASPSFDASVLELLLALSGPGTMVIAPPGMYGGRELAELLAEKVVTNAFITPAALASISPVGLENVRVVMVGGEASTPELVARWAPGRSFFNLYGPTETTIVAAGTDALPASLTGTVPIGSAMPGAPVYVLDSRLRPTPPGVTGELYVGGVTVTRGYIGRTGATSERFVADPFSAGGRLYRTGDVVRWSGASARSDSRLVLEYVGRADFQVKVRGHRIELGEVDSAFGTHADVEFSATFGTTGVGGSTSLVTYVKLVESATIDVAQLREWVSETLPAYMVPASIMVIDAIPLGPTGKLDRRALPEPTFEARVFRAPTTPIEEIVADAFADVLGLDRVGVDDDFFDLGGNSLSATQVVSRVGEALDTKVAVRMLFEASTVGALAGRVESFAGSGARTPLVAHPRPEAVPLSLAQQRMWFLNRFDTASAVNNIPIAIRMTGMLDIPALQVAVMDVIDRHESLRTVFPETANGPVQEIMDAARIVPDLRPIRVTSEQLLPELVGLASTGFDVTNEVPLHAALYQVSETSFVLGIVVHHISADGWSIGPLARDVMVAYAARSTWEAPQWVPLPVQYADFALWQREVLGSELDASSVISQQLAYWESVLGGVPDEVELPWDRPRPVVASYRGGRVDDVVIDAGLHAGISELARRYNATPFMVVHAALAVVLARLSGSDDVVVGTPVAGRGEAALDHLVGMFVNTLVLRTSVTGSMSFADLLREVSDSDLGAFGHSDVPFERLVEVLNPPRSQGRHPLFQVSLSFQNLGETTFELPDLKIAQVEFDLAQSKFDLSFTLTERFDDAGGFGGIGVEITYAVDLFDEVTVRGFGEFFVRVLSVVVAEPSVAVGDVELMDAGVRDVVVGSWSGVPALPAAGGVVVDGVVGEGVSGGLMGWFWRVVEVDPSATAVVFGGERVSFGELGVRVSRLARVLVGLGVGPEVFVAVALPRSVDVVVGLLAVVEAGGAYVPVDPSYPVERLRYVMEDAAPRVLLTSSAVVDGLPEPVDAVRVLIDRVDPSADASRLAADERLGVVSGSTAAYVIYTSGSTGKPKGVVVPHENVMRLLERTRSVYDFGSDDVWTMFHSYAFDFSVWELWGALLFGGRLVVVDQVTTRSPETFAQLVADEGVTVLNQTPSAFYQFDESVRSTG